MPAVSKTEACGLPKRGDSARQTSVARRQRHRMVEHVARALLVRDGEQLSEWGTGETKKTMRSYINVFLLRAVPARPSLSESSRRFRTFSFGDTCGIPCDHVEVTRGHKNPKSLSNRTRAADRDRRLAFANPRQIAGNIANRQFTRDSDKRGGSAPRLSP